jgi:protein O-GlcNAc transferase
MTDAAAMAIAVGHHQAGRLAEAESAYRQILLHQPDNTAALEYLGALMGQQGRFSTAEQMLRRVVAINPKVVGAHFTLGCALRDQGKIVEAVESFAAAVRQDPKFFDGFFNLGLALSDLGKAADAAAAYSKAIALKPDDADVWCNLGNALKESGNLDDAISAYGEAIELQPEFALAYYNLGIAIGKQGKRSEAIAAYRRTIEFDPAIAQAHYNLGNELCEIKDLAGAVEAYQRAIEVQPAYAEAYANLGNTLMKQAKRGGGLDQAVAAYCRAVELKPEYAEAYTNLGNARKEQGDLDGALACYERSMELRPGDAALHSNRVYTVHFHGGFDAAAILRENLEWDRRHGAALRSGWRAQENDRSAGRRLRVGYVSPDFCSHPIGRFLLPLMEAHDREQVEVFCYSDVAEPDEMTMRISERAAEWRSVVGMGDEAVAELIRADRIDVLVDLTMHMAGNRMPMFARKPAPVQMTYLAYCSTTGLAAMDYRLTDPYLDPPGMVGEYCEKSIWLTPTYWCYRPGMEAPEVGELPAKSAGAVTFGCLNNFCKVSPATLDVWGRLLAAIPESRLLLHSLEGEHQRRVVDLLASKGVERGRVEFVGFLPGPRYLEMYQRIDIGLDPFPYAGGMTTCDALWMGVPVVSLAGGTAVARAGVSILSNLRLQELVAGTEEEYVRIAVKLAGDLHRLEGLRKELRERMRASPLMDAERFARSVEGAYREGWRRWCDGEGR